MSLLGTKTNWLQGKTTVFRFFFLQSDWLIYFQFKMADDQKVTNLPNDVGRVYAAEQLPEVVQKVADEGRSKTQEVKHQELKKYEPF